MIIKRHKGELETIACLSDSSIVGKKFEEEKLQLDLTSEFYKGDEISDDEEIVRILKNSNIINVIGQESVDFIITHNFATIEQVKKIANIPYILIVL